MKYDFDTIINRNDTNSLKWDLFDVDLPMWVADMDFKAPPELTNDLKSKVNEAIYGYAIITDKWYDAYINWWSQYGIHMKKDELKFTTGVMPAISSIIRRLTKPQEKVLIQTPVYHVFFYVIEDNNRVVVENQLIYDGKNYSIDFKDLEEKLSDPDVTLMLLCNPHNPIGKIWSKDDLEKIGTLCDKYNVTVVADEIHCDLTDPGKKYIPFTSVSSVCEDISITTISPTKSFNIAGLKTAAVRIINKSLQEKVFKAIAVDGLGEPSTFAITGSISVYTKCKPWLTQLREYLYNNKQILNDYLINKLPDIKLVPGEATYLLWLDCSRLNIKSEEFSKFLCEKTGLLLSPGIQFGENGDQFLRINIACPKELLIKGLELLNKGVKLYKLENIK